MKSALIIAVLILSVTAVKSQNIGLLQVEQMQQDNDKAKELRTKKQRVMNERHDLSFEKFKNLLKCELDGNNILRLLHLIITELSEYGSDKIESHYSDYIDKAIHESEDFFYNAQLIKDEEVEEMPEHTDLYEEEEEIVEEYVNELKQVMCNIIFYIK